jgi:hypothetical protein
MIKIISRFRFLFILFGFLLNLFFLKSAKKYDPESKNSEYYILMHSDGYKGKFSNERGCLTIFE